MALRGLAKGLKQRKKSYEVAPIMKDLSELCSLAMGAGDLRPGVCNVWLKTRGAMWLTEGVEEEE